MKTYAKKFNAQRAAHVELGNDAIEGIDFRTIKIWEGEAKDSKGAKKLNSN